MGFVYNTIILGAKLQKIIDIDKYFCIFIEFCTRKNAFCYVELAKIKSRDNIRSIL